MKNPIHGEPAQIPEGAFYFMINVSYYEQDSYRFARHLLQKEYVGVVPGIGFGQCAEGFIRITFAATEDVIREGILRLKNFLHSNFQRT